MRDGAPVLRPVVSAAVYDPAVAIDIPEDLIELERSAIAEQKKAQAEPYSEERWAPWREAAEAFQAALTAHAEATPGVNRYELEMAVKKAVRHPEPGPE
jgi:hypothetical protein